MGLSLPANIIIVSIFFSAAALVAVGLRFYSRRVKRAPLGLDDYFIVPALVSGSALTADTEPSY